MVRRIVAIVFIYCCTSAAWVILGATLIVRSETAGSQLEGRVTSNWGSAHAQRPPWACFVDAPAARGDAETTAAPSAPAKPGAHGGASLERTRAEVRLDLTPRRKGLLWWNTYAVAFRGAYTFRNPDPRPRDLRFTFPLPADRSTYDDLSLDLDGAPLTWETRQGAVVASARLGPGEAVVLGVSYNSRGLDAWRYEPGRDATGIRDFALTATTNFNGFDFPENTLAPTTEERLGGGWRLTWRHQSLVTGLPISVTMPERLQPGPLAARMSFFAPVSLLFFFFLVFVITALRRLELHPMNYFFLGAAFFSFHLLFAYLVDLVPVQLAFALCALTSTFLVVSYLRLVAGLRFAALEAGMAQFVHLVLFSYAFFFRGFTGLTITVGAIATLFVTMQLTGRIRWRERFSRALSAAGP